MGEGDLKELRELVEFLKASKVAEFDMERPELKIRLKFAGAESGAAPSAGGVDLAQLAYLLQAGAGASAAVPVSASLDTQAATTAASNAQIALAVPEAEVDENAGLQIVKSPLVGTFYDAPSPGAESFVKIGDTVALGKVLCIVEAMKIMNEIESDAAGEVVKMFAKPGQPVEYGQPLFGLRAK